MYKTYVSHCRWVLKPKKKMNEVDSHLNRKMFCLPHKLLNSLLWWIKENMFLQQDLASLIKIIFQLKSQSPCFYLCTVAVTVQLHSTVLAHKHQTPSTCTFVQQVDKYLSYCLLLAYNQQYMFVSELRILFISLHWCHILLIQL